jgi:hypothetical protein
MSANDTKMSPKLSAQDSAAFTADQTVHANAEGLRRLEEWQRKKFDASDAAIQAKIQRMRNTTTQSPG